MTSFFETTKGFCFNILYNLLFTFLIKSLEIHFKNVIELIQWWELSTACWKFIQTLSFHHRGFSSLVLYLVPKTHCLNRAEIAEGLHLFNQSCLVWRSKIKSYLLSVSALQKLFFHAKIWAITYRKPRQWKKTTIFIIKLLLIKAFQLFTEQVFT